MARYSLRVARQEIDRAENYYRFYDSVLTPEEMDEKELCESSFYEFIRHAWFHIEGRQFIDGWHVKVVAEHLEALGRLDITDLLINIPFRTGKSLICSVLYLPWVWATRPWLRFLYTSYSHKLSLRDSVLCRTLLMSPWYQKMWGNQIQIRPDMKGANRFRNVRGGYRLCTSILGGNTGEGADFIVFDDPDNVTRIDSEIIRERTHDSFDFALSNRYQLIHKRRRLVVQQRCHTHDISGHIIMKDDPSWVHLCLPMEYEKSRKCSTIVLPSTLPHVWSDPREKEGELLWEAGVSAERLAKFKEFDFRNDAYAIAGQLQQRPSPEQGAIIKASWFKMWQEEWPHFEYILQSWDTAITGKETSAHSSCSTWGIFRYEGAAHIMLLSLFTGQVEYPELRKMAIRLARHYEDSYIDEPIDVRYYGERTKPDMVLVEGKASGPILIHDLNAAGVPVTAFNPTRWGNKVARARIASQLIEGGLVWLPTDPPGFEYLSAEASLFLEAATLFPNPIQGSSTNDIIDSMSQAFIRLKNDGWVANPDDPAFEKKENWH